jgi:hypothetical protein
VKKNKRAYFRVNRREDGRTYLKENWREEE